MLFKWNKTLVQSFILFWNLSEGDLLKAISPKRQKEYAGESYQFFNLKRTSRAVKDDVSPHKNELFFIIELANAIAYWEQNKGY